jgi:4-hydroxy-tetrahydrodipicolinate synthase
MRPFEPRGVIPACLLPFDEDLAIDERAYRSHLADLLAVEGISAITTNAHASEVHALTFDEQRRVLALTKETLGDRVATVAGVFTNSSLEAARIARMAQEEVRTACWCSRPI